MQSGSLEARAGSVFNSDPFGEDPFDQTDPFSDSDPFDTASFTDDKVNFRVTVLILLSTYATFKRRENI